MRSATILIGLFLLAGCSAVPGLAQIEGATLIATDKTLTDNLVSYYSGKNCSTLRSHQGLTYCEEDEVLPTPKLFCYKTLSKVTCYDRPDPWDQRRQEVDRNEHNYVKNY